MEGDKRAVTSFPQSKKAHSPIVKKGFSLQCWRWSRAPVPFIVQDTLHQIDVQEQCRRSAGCVSYILQYPDEKSNVEMKSKPGLGVLLLAALLGAIGFWLSNAAADIFYLLASESDTDKSHGSTIPISLTKAYESRIYNRKNPPVESLTVDTTSFTFSDIPTDSEERTPNSTQILTEIYPATTEKSNSSTEHLAPGWITVNMTTVQSPIDNSTGTGADTATITTSNHTHSTPITSFTGMGSVTHEVTTVKMEADKSVCISTSSLTDAEVFAIVIGAVFLTIVLSAILYQFAVFLRKKQTTVDSSIYIIENEHQKHDLEANGLQVDTRL
ncbi:uncharacterized protein [Pyxicephalus adspersus]|uniref:uncharacterized protein n=1 Tax=Pyxicephalus adspersus TaxID=30357 RepID=UPI003B58F8CA